MPKEADSLWMLVQTRNGMSAESRCAKCVIAARSAADGDGPDRTAAEGDWLAQGPSFQNSLESSPIGIFDVSYSPTLRSLR
jgi:hypothetical protein